MADARDRKEWIMKRLKRLQAFALVLIVALGVAVLPTAVSAKAAPKLSKTKITLTAGKSTTLTLKNAPKGRKVTWSTSDKKVATVSQKGKVTAKKAGTATITAKVSNKKYTCKVTVKSKPADTPADNPATEITFTNEAGKDAGDVAALEAIIREQNKNGANMPTDLDTKKHYFWKEGRLYRFSYLALGGDPKTQPPLKGNLDLTPFSEIHVVQCIDNQLTSINVKGLKKLETLECTRGTLTSLDLSTNTALTKLYISKNQLTSLDVSANTALKTLSCDNNQLTSLDVSANTALEYLYCQKNQFTALDVSANMALKEMFVDKGVQVTGTAIRVVYE